jgi:nucleotide-binding universal stress UspA family protein
MFKKIMVATDMVSAADAPVITAARMARRNDARLFLLHVMESASTENRRLVRHFRTGAELIADSPYIEAIRQSLDGVYGDDMAALAHEVRITAGYPWQEILAWSKDVEADLIVLGPHSTRAEEKGVVRVAGRVGSTVENVVTRETCPVMIVNQATDDDQLRFQRVLVPVDFSRSCECAICFAAKLATRFHSRVTAFHMLPVPPIPKYAIADYLKDKEHARRRLDDLYEDYLSGFEHTYRVRGGAIPHQEILRCVEEEKIDLVIMGSHTKEATGKWYPGSVVERVGFRAGCPVMVITDPDVLIHWQGAVKEEDQARSNHLIHVFTRS